MKVSILVSYYNQEDYVARNLDSILCQKTDFDFEILVGDDGSDDLGPEIVRSYIEKFKNKYQSDFKDRIKLFTMPRDRNKKHRSINRVSDNRLNLLAQARGEYFSILDGDDFYLNSNFLQEAVNILDERPMLSGAAFDFAFVYDNNEAELVPLGQPEGLIDLKSYMPASYIHVGAMLFRKQAEDKKLAYLRRKQLFDDNLITFYMLRHGPIYYKPLPAYAYCIHEEGGWSSAQKIEQDLLNAMDFNIARNILPEKYKDLAFLRYFKPMEFVYKNKEQLPELLGDKEQEYLDSSLAQNANFIHQLLKWNEISTGQKRRVARYFREYTKKFRSLMEYFYE